MNHQSATFAQSNPQQSVPHYYKQQPHYYKQELVPNYYRQQPTPNHNKKNQNYQPLLSNVRSSNSANYIPSKIYESYQQQNNTSQSSHISQHTNALNQQQLNAYEKLSQLNERLKNVHHFYQLRISQERQKSSQRNQVFMSIVQELQRNHNDKIALIKKEISMADEEKNQVGYVDDKMSQIKSSIDQILKQSASYKASNEKLQRQIMQKQQLIREKQRNLQKVKKEEKEFRDQLEQFMKINIKENRRQREMLQMIDNVIGLRN